MREPNQPSETGERPAMLEINPGDFAPDVKVYEHYLKRGHAILGDLTDLPPGLPFERKLRREIIGKWWDSYCGGGSLAAQDREFPHHAEHVVWSTKMVLLLDKIVQAANLRFWDVEPRYESAAELLATFQ